jgi:hypothetical protein
MDDPRMPTINIASMTRIRAETKMFIVATFLRRRGCNIKAKIITVAPQSSNPGSVLNHPEAAGIVTEISSRREETPPSFV